MALYLKYRPQDFSSLVGQQFIKETLKKAIAEDKTVGAYMFTGPRGTGKTSTARIFAKAINCENPKDGDPCLECSICKAFAEDSLIDIIEIDAASHTGVDNIREIIEKAQFRPTVAKYKVYIIDEVHMLSKGAFNALLKILEEPPNHIKFILATTEIHKVPETILSRCQRYDFRNFSAEDIRGRLEYIAQSEGVSVDEESYNYIIKNAEGGMRNAVSLFEQLISGNTISYNHIVETLGVASEDEKQDFIQALMNQDIHLIENFDTLRENGKNLKNFFKEILSDIQKNTIEKLKNTQDIEREIHIMDGISDMLMKSKNSFDEFLTLRIGLIKLVSGYVAVTQSGNQNQKPVVPNVVASKKQEVVTPQKEEAPEKSIADEAEDIFASSLVSKENSLGTSVSPSEQGGFQSDTLIAEVKNKGGKAALIMSLKGSSFRLEQTKLSVYTKTKISFNTVSKPENKEIITLAGEELGLGFTELVIS